MARPTMDTRDWVRSLVQRLLENEAAVLAQVAQGATGDREQRLRERAYGYRIRAQRIARGAPVEASDLEVVPASLADAYGIVAGL